MKVFLAGATGVLGRATIREILARGHEVVALARSEENVRAIHALGATPARADLFDASSLATAMAGCHVVVRAATHIPSSAHPKPADWAPNDRIRREGTRALLDAAEKVGARRFVQESVVWVARRPDGAPFDECSPPHPDLVTQSALDAERLAAAARVPTTTLRFGWFYGPQSGHTRAMAAALRARQLPIVGDGAARLSFLHEDDAARAIAAALHRQSDGVFHVVDDRPTPVAEFFDTFARAIGAPPPPRVPRAPGGSGTDFLSTPMVTSAKRFREATGWQPTFPTVHEGLTDVAARFR